ncbi:MAG TPA: hypothetical protein VFR87_06570 [Nocardioidaceae bacterium]|nr:hypothetical protein [Nocardioidaceae bacterium]
MSTPTLSSRKRFLCRFGVHKYVLRINSESAERFHECRYCGKFDPRSSSTRGGNGYAIG